MKKINSGTDCKKASIAWGIIQKMKIKRETGKAKMSLLLTLLSLLLCVGVMGCKSNREQKTIDVAKYWHVVTIDGCQYLENSRWNDVPIVHKANCNNPIHNIKK